MIRMTQLPTLLLNLSCVGGGLGLLKSYLDVALEYGDQSIGNQRCICGIGLYAPKSMNYLKKHAEIDDLLCELHSVMCSSHMGTVDLPKLQGAFNTLIGLEYEVEGEIQSSMGARYKGQVYVAGISRVLSVCVKAAMIRGMTPQHQQVSAICDQLRRHADDLMCNIGHAVDAKILEFN